MTAKTASSSSALNVLLRGASTADGGGCVSKRSIRVTPLRPGPARQTVAAPGTRGGLGFPLWIYDTCRSGTKRALGAGCGSFAGARRLGRRRHAEHLCDAQVRAGQRELVEVR